MGIYRESPNLLNEWGNMKLGFLVDLNLCMGCKGCEVACKVENEVPLSSWRLRVKYIDIRNFSRDF